MIEDSSQVPFSNSLDVSSIEPFLRSPCSSDIKTLKDKYFQHSASIAHSNFLKKTRI
jgi:hypothetical protein